MHRYILLFVLVVLSYGIEFYPKSLFISKIDLSQGFKKGNVIQGITFFKNQWIISQTNNNKRIIFSFINKDGKLIKQIIINYSSHGQDLSFLKYKNKNFLITSAKKNQGIAIFHLKDKNITFYKEVLLSLGFNTPAASKNSKYIAVKNYNRLDIYRTIDIFENRKPLAIYSFILDTVQQKKSQWFQGLALKDNYIYTLSGNKKISGKKFLIIYDTYGQVVKKIELFVGKKFAIKEGNKWELEGLTFVNNSLYTTVMTGRDGKNIKRLYKILEIK